MASIWVESLSRSFDQALDLMAAAVRDCTDDLWESGMWQVTPPGADHQFLGSDWSPITDEAQRSTLIERWVHRRSTPWSVAWHALEVFDYDLNGEFGPWTPPPPFAGHPHWRDLPGLPAAWSRSEIGGYIDHCRQRAHDTLEDMTDERAATLLPPAHRNEGQPYSWSLTGLAVHTTEHAAQIRQFITTAGIAIDIA